MVPSATRVAPSVDESMPMCSAISPRSQSEGSGSQSGGSGSKGVSKGTADSHSLSLFLTHKCTIQHSTTQGSISNITENHWVGS